MGKRTPTPQRAEQVRQALELRAHGSTYRQIADEMGWASTASAHEAVREALHEVIREPAEEVLLLELQRLDVLLAEAMALVHPPAVAPVSPQTTLPAIDRVLRIMERRAALLGLDRPHRVALEHRPGGVSEALLEMGEEGARIVAESAALLARHRMAEG